MPRLELTLKTDYVPRWGLDEGIREFISNGHDAEIEFGAKMEIDWYQNLNADDEQKRIGVLRIENTGTTLPREALLFGYTTKTGKSGLVGKHAEGLKCGSLVLIRNGHNIVIRSGSEVWEPAIEHSDKFDANVLVFNIAENRKFENRVRVEISGISREYYDSLSDKFLFLLDQKKDMGGRIKLNSGELLVGPAFAGKIFVRGVWVKDFPDAQFGYNLFDCEIDRDRRMVDTYDVQRSIRSIWSDALQKTPALAEMFFTMCEDNKADIQGIDTYNAAYLPEAARVHAGKKFLEKYGADAIPVLNMAESAEVEHYGKRGIVVNKALAAILLSAKIDSFAKVKESMKSATKKLYSWSELSPVEQENINDACMILNTVYELDSCAADFVAVVDFIDPKLNGLYKPGKKQTLDEALANDRRASVQIAKHSVQTPEDTMTTLVHEFAHHISSAADGEKSHVAAIEAIWKKVYAYMRRARA